MWVVEYWDDEEYIELDGGGHADLKDAVMRMNRLKQQLKPELRYTLSGRSRYRCREVTEQRELPL